MKAATLKDVLYALEFTGARLCRSTAGAWTVEPGGTKVPSRIADEARAHVDRTEAGLDGHEVFAWRRSAA